MQFGKVISRFHDAFVIKRLVYIEFRVFRKKKKVGGAEKAQRSYNPFAGLGRDKAFWLCVATWFLCRDMVPKLQAVVGSRQGFSWSR